MTVFFLEKREAIRNELIDIGRENSLCVFWSCEIIVRVLDRNWIVSFNEKSQVISKYHREDSAQGRWAQHLWQVWEVWQSMPHIVSWAHATYASGLCKKNIKWCEIWFFHHKKTPHTTINHHQTVSSWTSAKLFSWYPGRGCRISRYGIPYLQEQLFFGRTPPLHVWFLGGENLAPNAALLWHSGRVGITFTWMVD